MTDETKDAAAADQPVDAAVVAVGDDLGGLLHRCLLDEGGGEQRVDDVLGRGVLDRERHGDDVGGLGDGGLFDELCLHERPGDVHRGHQLDLLGGLDGVLGLHLDAQLLADHREGIGRDHRLHQREAAGVGDRVTQARGPVVLDHEDCRGAAGGDALRELLHAVGAETVIPLGDGEGTQHLALDHALDPARVEADEAARDRAQAHPLGLGQVGQVHRVLDAAVHVLLDEQDVDDPDDAALADPAELGQDLARRLELVEPDHEDLDRARDVLLAHVLAPCWLSCCRPRPW